jgi:NAD(P)-dependent dehydrogenase (short-subunit alcohol dehydrogenase family)
LTPNLQGKVALVTGGASGIGLAAVERLIMAGAQVLMTDIQDDKGRALEPRFGGQMAYQRCDVLIEAEIEDAVAAAVRRFGGLDILFNNAGQAGPYVPIEATDADAWDRTFALLVRSAALGMKHATPVMHGRGGGAVINTASIAGMMANCGPTDYSAAKAAVIQLTKSAAAELGPLGIRVNAICPGLIATSIFGVSMGLDRNIADQMAAQIGELAWRFQPLNKSGAATHVADAVVFLASEAAAFVSGASLVVDGAYSTGASDPWASGLFAVLEGAE